MKEVCLYGAGKKMERFLAVLLQDYSIKCIIDADSSKWGTLFNEIPIVESLSNYASFAVIICIKDIESALNSVQSLGFNEILFLFADERAGNGAVYEYKTVSISAKKNVFHALCNTRPLNIYLSDDWNLNTADKLETPYVYDNAKKRVFNIFLSPDKGGGGGPEAVHRNIRLANERYGLISNLFSINCSQIYCPALWDNYTNQKPLLTEACRNTDIGSFAFKLSIYSQVTWNILYLEIGMAVLLSAHKLFHFCSDDIFLLHGPFCVHAFCHTFENCKNVFSGYHAQGSLNSELGDGTEAVKYFYDNIQYEHLRLIKNWVFPSEGARDSLLATGSEAMRETAKDCDFHIAYNGYSPKGTLSPDGDFLSFLDNLSEPGDNRLIFVSASHLYRQKGIERIPRILSQLMEVFGLNILWVLLGSGEMEYAVDDAIKTYLKEDEYIWQRKFLSQENLFALLQKADFYIMMHYISIFDYSTLQAMAYGCIPFLSNVGGNRELVGFSNGVLINPEESDNDLLENFKKYLNFADGKANINSEILKQDKEKNKGIVLEHFSDMAFLYGYKKAIQGLLN